MPGWASGPIAQAGPLEVTWQRRTFPGYGSLAAFTAGSGAGMLRVRGLPADFTRQLDGQMLRRIGYDLFDEVRHLLTQGQPPDHALVPTLELHIDLMRQCLRDGSVSYVEVLPRPQDRDFICCLTHDVDFFGIRRHTWDRTLLGFLSRGTAGTLRDLWAGRRTLREALRNWLAVLRLPLVFVRLAPDFWQPFKQYAKADNGRPSTFFLSPFRAPPGYRA